MGNKKAPRGKKNRSYRGLSGDGADSTAILAGGLEGEASRSARQRESGVEEPPSADTRDTEQVDRHTSDG